MKQLASFAVVLVLVGAASIFSIGSGVAQQTFSCPYGKQASCLDYGDKVCSSSSKCVDHNSICFSSYECNYEGFICKSKYDKAVDEYNDLLQKNMRLDTEYSSLLRKDNELVDKYNSLLDEHNRLVNKYNSLLKAYQGKNNEYENLLSEKSEIESCIADADTLDEAQECTQ